jgi:orotidine-5'-phosphate decarboxylase
VPNFAEKLSSAAVKNKSLLCVRLDPDLSMIPAESVLSFNKLVIEATIDCACAYKPNLAIYEAMGRDGLQALDKTLETIREMAPWIPIIGDGKRSDIGLCSFAYAKRLFDEYKFDAVTVNPYMGPDALTPFLERRDRGVFVLCHTSNRGAVEIQELMVVRKGEDVARPLYEVVAELAGEWNTYGNVGLVVGATYPEQIARVRKICPDMQFLIPGVGFQGGDIARTVEGAMDSRGMGFTISVSRQIMYASRTPGNARITPVEAMKKMRRVANHLRDEINRYTPAFNARLAAQLSRGNGSAVVGAHSERRQETSVQ